MINKIIKAFIDNASVGLVLLNREERIETANSAILKILGVKLSEIKGISASDFIERFFRPDNKPCLDFDCRDDKRIVLGKRKGLSYVIRCFSVPNVISKSYFLMSVVDISEVKEYKESVENLRGIALMKSIIEFVPDMLFVINTNGRVIVWNKTAENLTGIPKKRILGKGNYEYALPFYGKRRPMLIDFALTGKKPDKDSGYESVKYENGAITAISEYAHLKGKKKILWGKASRFYDHEGNIMGAIEVVRDITDMKKMEKKLKYMAERDPLTDTFNRRQFETLLSHEISRAERTGEPLTLIYLDVDNLKEINDTFGHEKGDELLVKVAEALKKGLRRSDIIARVGGDEFIIVTPGLRKENAEKLIDRLRRKILKESKDLPYKIDFSYGMAEITPGTEARINQIVADADREMYRMKKLKKAEAG